jgi:hypothetical protein
MNRPEHESPNDVRSFTESKNSVYYYDDGPGDTTVRPASPNTPLGWYPRVPRPIRRPLPGEDGPKADGPETT